MMLRYSKPGENPSGTTDILIEGIHFEQAWMDPYHLGKKALAVNLSDIAAWAEPRYFLLSLGSPSPFPVFCFSFLSGDEGDGKPFQVKLIGGIPRSRQDHCQYLPARDGEKEALLYRNGPGQGMTSSLPERSGFCAGLRNP